MKDLSRLNLWGNRIEDLTPLAALPNLEWVDLRDNAISDVGPLARKEKLSKLFLAENRIADVASLEALLALEWLVLDANEIESIEPLTELPKLLNLSVTNNRVGYKNWPETSQILGLLEKAEVQVHFAPQKPLSVYAETPGSKLDQADPDAEVMS